MRLEFRHECPSLAETMQFEHLFEGDLQMNEEDRADLNENCISTSTWLYVDGQLTGEQVLVDALDFEPRGREPWDLPEIVATNARCAAAAYVYSTTLLPEYQGQGLGKILSAYVLGHLRGDGFYKELCGHATSPGMAAIRHELGAVFGPTHEDWFGSGRKAEFYVITL